MSTESKFLKERSRMRLNSLIPRGILLLLACISIICFVVTLALSNSKNWPEDLGMGYWELILALASVLPSLCWASFCLLRRRFSTSPLHPGCLLSLDLICFLAIASCCSLALPSSTYWVYGQECLVPTSDASNGPVSARCERLIHLVRGLEMTAYAAAYLLAIVHFIMFALACRATDLYNREKKRRNKAGKQVELPAYPFHESQEPIVGIGSPHELDTRKSQSSKGGCAWISEVGSGHDHDCAAELDYGRNHSLADEYDSVKKSTL